jgi:hypothetical protein
MADEVRSLKQGIGGVGRGRYDIVAALPPGLDPDPHLAAGATWWLVEFPRDDPSIDLVRGVILDGPGSTKLSTTRPDGPSTIHPGRNSSKIDDWIPPQGTLRL